MAVSRSSVERVPTCVKRPYVIISTPCAHRVTKRETKVEDVSQWNCFPERRLNRNQARFRGLVWKGRRGGGASLRTGDGECERCRVEAFPPFFFEFTWLIWRERERERQRGVPPDAVATGSLIPGASS